MPISLRFKIIEDGARFLLIDVDGDCIYPCRDRRQAARIAREIVEDER